MLVVVTCPLSHGSLFFDGTNVSPKDDAFYFFLDAATLKSEVESGGHRWTLMWGRAVLQGKMQHFTELEIL